MNAKSKVLIALIFLQCISCRIRTGGLEISNPVRANSGSVLANMDLDQVPELRGRLKTVIIKATPGNAYRFPFRGQTGFELKEVPVGEVVFEVDLLDFADKRIGYGMAKYMVKPGVNEFDKPLVIRVLKASDMKVISVTVSITFARNAQKLFAATRTIDLTYSILREDGKSLTLRKNGDRFVGVIDGVIRGQALNGSIQMIGQQGKKLKSLVMSELQTASEMVWTAEIQGDQKDGDEVAKVKFPIKVEYAEDEERPALP